MRMLLQQLVLLVSFSWFALCARYEWRGDWRVVNNSSLKVLKAGQGYGKFRVVVAAAGVPVVSDNATVGLAFLNFNGSGQYFLSLMLGVETGEAVPIWTANRNAPVSEGAEVQILSGQMRLLDSQGNRVWGPFKQLIRGVELHENGNFRLYDDQNTTLWQSFDDLTDVLMPAQKFATGSKLIANMNQSSMAAGGFVTAMEPSGLALYLTSVDSMAPPQAYSISTMQNTTVKRQLSTVLHQCPSYHAVFSHQGADMLLEYEANANFTTAPPCAQPRKVHFPFINVSLAMRFLRLESYGDLVSYGYDSQKSEWRGDFSWEVLVSGKVCPYPLSCGQYGMCQSAPGAPSCKCLSEKTRSFDIDSNKACPAPPSWTTSIAEECGKDDSQSGFLDIVGVSYFSTKLLQPDMVTSLTSCLDLCKSNCSCAAAFYNKDSMGCFFVEEVLGSLDFDATAVVQYSAHLKFRNPGADSAGGRKANTSHVKVATIVSAVVLVGISGTIILTLWLRRRRKLQSEAAVVKSLLTAIPGAPPHRFSYKSLSLATKGFTQMLGSGGFGSVYAGTLPDNTRLAVKRLDAHTKQGHKEFTAEIVSLGSISHVNIVRLCGYCIQGASRLLVYEHVANGSLDKWLFGHDREFSWKVRCDIALGTARGLAYLHDECREPIIHLDIKPQNILLDGDFTAKVADFGLSKLLTSRGISQVMTGVRGTPGYLAPEWLLDSVATKKCDVYSYGMVLLELVSGRRNIEPGKLGSSGEGASWYFPLWVVSEVREGRMMNAVDERIRCPEIFEQVERTLRVALWCIQESASARPSMSTVVQMLEGHVGVPEPPARFHFLGTCASSSSGSSAVVTAGGSFLSGR